MNSGRLHAGTLLLLALMTANSPASETETVRSTPIITAIEAAVESDPRMNYLRRTYTEKIIRTGYFLRLHMPEFFFGYSGSESYGLFTPYSLSHTLWAGIQVPIVSSAASARLAEREHLLKLRQLELMMTERTYDLVRDVFSLSLELLLCRREIDLYSRLLAFQLRRLETAACLRDRGEITDSDITSILIETDRRRLDLEERELQRAGFRREFSLLVCEEGGELHRPDGILRNGALPQIDKEIPVELVFFQKKAGIGNIRLREALAERESIEIDAVHHRRRYVPAVDILGTFQLKGDVFPPHLPSFSVGVHISSSGPLLQMEVDNRIEKSRTACMQTPRSELRIDSGACFQQSRIIESRLSNSQRQKQWIERQVQIQVRRIFDEIVLLHKRHELHLRKADAAAEELSLIKRQESFGQVSLKELMETEITFTRHQLDVYRSSTECCLKELELLLVCGLEDELPLLIRRYIDSGEAENDFR